MASSRKINFQAMAQWLRLFECRPNKTKQNEVTWT